MNLSFSNIAARTLDGTAQEFGNYLPAKPALNLRLRRIRRLVLLLRREDVVGVGVEDRL